MIDRWYQLTLGPSRSAEDESQRWRVQKGRSAFSPRERVVRRSSSCVPPTSKARSRGFPWVYALRLQPGGDKNSVCRDYGIITRYGQEVDGTERSGSWKMS